MHGTAPSAGRVALLRGCAQSVLRPDFNEAAIRLLTRHGSRWSRPRARAAAARSPTTWARRIRPTPRPSSTIDAWIAEMDGAGLDAILVTASGCGTTIKDYGFMFRDDPAYAEKARRVSAIAKDVTEYMAQHRPDAADRRDRPRGRLPLGLLDAARPGHPHRAEEPPEDGGLHREGRARGPHLLRLGRHLQHPAARDRRTGCGTARSPTSSAMRPDVIATGNIGCATQIGKGTGDPDRPHGRNCSTGRPAARSPRHWPGWHRGLRLRNSILPAGARSRRRGRGAAIPGYAAARPPARPSIVAPRASRPAAGPAGVTPP